MRVCRLRTFPIRKGRNNVTSFLNKSLCFSTARFFLRRLLSCSIMTLTFTCSISIGSGESSANEDNGNGEYYGGRDGRGAKQMVSTSWLQSAFLFFVFHTGANLSKDSRHAERCHGCLDSRPDYAIETWFWTCIPDAHKWLPGRICDMPCVLFKAKCSGKMTFNIRYTGETGIPKASMLVITVEWSESTPENTFMDLYDKDTTEISDVAIENAKDDCLL